MTYRQIVETLRDHAREAGFGRRRARMGARDEVIKVALLPFSTTICQGE